MRTIAFYSQDPGAGVPSLALGVAREAARLGPAGGVALLGCDLANDGGEGGGAEIRVCQEDEIAAALDQLGKDGVDLALAAVPAAAAEEDTAATLRAADLVVLPVRPEPDRIDSVAHSIEAVERETKPFLFVINLAEPEGEDTMATAVALAGYGTICPVIVPESAAQDADAPVFADVFQYLLGRLEKATGKTGEPPRPQVAAKADERRAFPRWECTLPGTLICGECRIPCRITDISGGGMSVECDVPLAVGARAVIETPRLGPMEVEVRYSSPRRLGLMFTMDTTAQTDLIMLMASTIERARRRA